MANFPTRQPFRSPFPSARFNAMRDWLTENNNVPAGAFADRPVLNAQSAVDERRAGRMYFETDNDTLYVWNGTAWIRASGLHEETLWTGSESLTSSNPIRVTWAGENPTPTMDITLTEDLDDFAFLRMYWSGTDSAVINDTIRFAQLAGGAFIRLSQTIGVIRMGSAGSYYLQFSRYAGTPNFTLSQISGYRG